MYKVQHLLDENEKITTLNSEMELIGFTFLIISENDDLSEVMIQSKQDCIDYLNEFCPNLKLM